MYYDQADVPVASVDITPEQMQRYADVYYKLYSFWQGSTTAEMVFIRGNEEWCAIEQTALTTSLLPVLVPGYCREPNQIAITGLFVAHDNPELTNYSIRMQKAGEVFVVAHEGGHNLQDNDGTLSDSTDVAVVSASELQADCYAGRFVGKSGFYDTQTVNG